MDKDAANLKKWLITMGLDIDVTSDEMMKKLIPPQRRDMWRNIVKHVRPEQEVNLIKKALLLHKLQTLQKPLPATVESKEDLSNALKYEELLSKYNKIEKEIADIKNKNGRMEIYLEKMELVKDNLNRANQFSTNKSYLALHKTAYYNKFYHVIDYISELCGYFAVDANKDLTKTDYEDSLIKCFALVDDAKQAGTMNESVNLGKNLCNAFYSTIKDKSPAILIQTIEDNLNIRISEIFKILTDTSRSEDSNIADREILFKDFFLKLLRKQLELKTMLSKSEAEKDRVAKKLIEDAGSIKNDIISLFELQNVTHTPGQRYVLKKNISDAFEVVIKNCLDCTKVVGWPEKHPVEGETLKTLDNIFDKTTQLNDKIERKRLEACEMLKELNEKKSNFGITEINTIMEKIAENYSNKVTNIDEMNNLMISMQNVANSDVVKSDKAIDESAIKKEAQKFRTLWDIADHIESLDVMTQLRKKFEDINNILCAENNFDEIKKRENAHSAEYESLISQMKSQLSVLKDSVEDSKLVAAGVKLNKKPGN